MNTRGTRHMTPALAGLALLMIMYPVIAAGQETSAEISRVEVREDESVLIVYNLNGQKDMEYLVEAYLISKSNPPLRLSTVTGDIGEGNFSGSGRSIVWNRKADFPKAARGEQYEFELVVSKRSGGGFPWYAYAGAGVLAAGAAVLILNKKQGNTEPPAVELAIPKPPARP